MAFHNINLLIGVFFLTRGVSWRSYSRSNFNSPYLSWMINNFLYDFIWSSIFHTGEEYVEKCGYITKWTGRNITYSRKIPALTKLFWRRKLGCQDRFYSTLFSEALSVVFSLVPGKCGNNSLIPGIRGNNIHEILIFKWLKFSTFPVVSRPVSCHGTSSVINQHWRM